MKLFELFSGFGGASFALKKAGVPFECVGHSEIDKHAIRCYEQNHPNIRNYGDITKIVPEELPDFDLLTGGFPCQNFSVAGKGLGELDPRGTLFWDIIRIAEVKQPKFMLLENVKGLTTKKHKATFDKILGELRRIGYGVEWKVLNSKEHGIPQNRERVWFVCKLGGWEAGEFSFPEKEELKIFVKDILEGEVDEKYYLKPHQVAKIEEALREKFAKKHWEHWDYVQIDSSGKGYNSQQDRVRNAEGVMNTIPSDGNSNKVKIFAMRGRNPDDPSSRIAGLPTVQTPEIRSDGCSNSLTSVEKDNYVIDSRNYKGEENKRVREDGCSPTLMARARTDEAPVVMNAVTPCFGRQGSSSEFMVSYEKVLSVAGVFRRLTPIECMRLMGFLNDEITLEGISDTQRYKLAGNGWEINVVSKIFEQMFKERT